MYGRGALGHGESSSAAGKSDGSLLTRSLHASPQVMIDALELI